MNFKKLVYVMALGLGLVATAGTAQGALLSFEDDDVEAVFRPVGGTLGAPLTSGTLSVGDVLVSVFEVPTFTIDGANAIPTGQELTGIAVVQIASISGAGTAGATFTFQPYTGGLNAVLAAEGSSTTVTNGGAGGGATIAMFFNGTGGGADVDLLLNRTTDPATNCPTVAFCVQQATLGTTVEVDGLGADADAFWRAVQTAPTGGDIGAVLATSNTLPIATAAFATTAFSSIFGPIGFQNIATGAPCPTGNTGADGCIQGLVGQAPITGGAGLSNGFIAHSDFDAIKLTTVPEPGTLALLSLGLLAVGVRFSRRGS